MRYLLPCLLFLANDECFSVLALLILFIMFVVDIWKAKPKYDAD